MRNPERLNLDRRQLEQCPLLEQEQRLRLLNYQNNSIRSIQNLENLPNLIFLDLYNNQIRSLDGPLGAVRGLRVLMAGKNKIGNISNLSHLRKLDVLDLHSNDIRVIDGLDGLADLRVLNLAGNRIPEVHNLSSLVSLTELNLRRNCIEKVYGLHLLPSLQRVFLSHNLISSFNDVMCLFKVSFLIELSLDGNPLIEKNPEKYRNQAIAGISSLRHLDLKRITDEEREVALREESEIESVMRRVIDEFHNEKGDRRDIGELAAGEVRVGGGDGFASTSLTNDEDTSNTNPALHLGSGNRDRTGSGDSFLDPPVSKPSLGLDRSASWGSFREDGTPLDGSVLDPQSFIGGKGFGGGGGGGGVEKENPLNRERERVGYDRAHYKKDLVSVDESEGIRHSLVELSRANNLPLSPAMLEIEMCGTNEKAVIAVGNSGEWVHQSKRMFVNVTEMSLFHMKREIILNKLSGVLQSQPINTVLPLLKTLRLVNNDFIYLSHLEFIPEIFGGNLEHLYLVGSPVCVSSESLLRSYFTATIPQLKTYNGYQVTSSDREASKKAFQGMLNLQNRVSSYSSKSCTKEESVIVNIFKKLSSQPTIRPRPIKFEVEKHPAFYASVGSEELGVGLDLEGKMNPNLYADALAHRRMEANFELAFQEYSKKVLFDMILQAQDDAFVDDGQE